MDLHEKLMKHRTIETFQFLLLTSKTIYSQNQSDNRAGSHILTEIVLAFGRNIEGSYKYAGCSQLLQTFRSILCVFYQERVNPNRCESYAEIIQTQLNYYRSHKINIDKILKILDAQLASGQSAYLTNVSLVLEILVLHMTLFCDDNKIWKYVEELQDSIRLDLIEKKHISLPYIKFMNSYIDSLLLNQKNSKSINKSAGARAMALFLKNTEAWFSLENDEECQLLTLILPKLIQLAGGDEVLVKVWEMVLESKNSIDSKLSILNSTADVWFPIESTCDKLYFDQTMREPFWLLLLNGLSSPHLQSRKQALFLIRKFLNFVEKQDTQSFIFHTYREVRPLVCGGNDSQKNSFKKRLDNFLSMLEALDDKYYYSRVALISPVETQLNEIFDEKYDETGIHIAWIRCIFIRVLQHNDNTIRQVGLLHALRLDPELYSDDLLSAVLKALNGTNMQKNSVNKKEPILEALTKFLNNAEANNTDLMTKFIIEASKISWKSAEFYYIIHAISMVNQVGSIWKEVELEAVKSLAEFSSTIQCPILRIGSQIELLETITHFATEFMDLATVVNTLSAFSINEALIRGQVSWHGISAWLSKIITKEQAISFLNEICKQLADNNLQLVMSIKSCSLMIMLFNDACLILNSRQCPGLTALRNLLHCLIGADSRAYANAEIRQRSIELIDHLLSFITSRDDILCELVSDYADVILRLIFKILRSTLDKPFATKVDTYVSITQKILTAEGLIISKREVLNHIERFEVESWNIIEDVEFRTDLQRLFGIEILYICLKLTSSKLRNYRFIGYLYNTYKSPVKMHSLEDKTDTNETSNENRISLKEIETKYYSAVAALFHEYLKEEPADEWVKDMNWFTQIAFLIEVGNEDILVSLVGILSQLFYKETILTTDMADFQSALRKCWASMRTSNKFQLALEKMMDLIFSAPFLESNETRELTLEFTHEILVKPDEFPEQSITLSKGLKQMKREYLDNFHQALLICLLYGSDLCEDGKYYLQARSYILDCYRDSYPNYLSDINANTGTVIRAHAVILLHKMISDNPNHVVKLLPEIVKMLEESEGQQKNRILQILLIIRPILEHEDDIISLNSMLWNSTLSKIDPPSVRIMQEWLLIGIHVESDSLRSRIWDMFDECQEKRMGSLNSVINVVYHVARLLSSDLQPEFINLALQHIMPCCLTQQVDVQSYAQIVVFKLYNLAKEMSYLKVMEKYEVLYIAITKSLKYESLMKVSTELQEDFYITVFNPIDDYSLQTLFYELPRLTNIAWTEFIPPQMFEKFGFKESNSHPLKLLNVNNNMKEANISARYTENK